MPVVAYCGIYTAEIFAIRVMELLMHNRIPIEEDYDYKDMQEEDERYFLEFRLVHNSPLTDGL